MTCSLMLKSVRTRSDSRDLERTISMMETMEKGMDEVLLSSVVEACVRHGRADLLAPILKLRKQVKAMGAHTYASLIRAHGFVRDPEGVWAIWREMRSRRVPLTSVTLLLVPILKL